jgi:hypothetical protein
MHCSPRGFGFGFSFKFLHRVYRNHTVYQVSFNIENSISIITNFSEAITFSFYINPLSSSILMLRAYIKVATLHDIVNHKHASFFFRRISNTARLAW